MNELELKKQLLTGKNISKIIKKNLNKDYCVTIEAILDTIFYLIRCDSNRENIIQLLTKELRKISSSNLSVEKMQILYGLISQFEVEKISTLPKTKTYNWKSYLNIIHSIISLEKEDINKICFSRVESPKRIKELQTSRDEIEISLINNRVDYTSQEVVTIDTHGSKCLDDGVCLEYLEDGSYNLYVHITDIPSIVAYNSDINKTAFQLKKSIYLPNVTISLFPESISYDKGSLLPLANKNVITYKFRVDPNYNVLLDTLEITRGIINVKHCLTYDDVDEKINSGEYGTLELMLRRLALIASQLRKSNAKKDKYRQLENYLLGSKKTNSAMASSSYAANLVQEMMILVNNVTAQHFKKEGFPFIYRANNNNSGIEYDLLLKTILDNEDNLTSDDYKNIKNQILSSYYTTEPCHHDGLNLDSYSHVSSPARRYGDYVNQYFYYESQKKPIDCRIYELENIAKVVASFLNHDDEIDFKKRKALAKSYKTTMKWRDGSL